MKGKKGLGADASTKGLGADASTKGEKKESFIMKVKCVYDLFVYIRVGKDLYIRVL